MADEFSIHCPKQLKYMIRNLEIEDEDILKEAISEEEIITVVSDDGLKQVGGFEWVVALDEEVFATCYGRVTGSVDQLSYFAQKPRVCPPPPSCSIRSPRK